MEKIWYIKIYGNREGPFSVLDLKRDRRINPDTLVWRQGFDRWQPIRYVPELQIIFEDDEETIEKEYEESKKIYPDDDEIVLDMQNKFPNKWIFVVIAVALAAYLWLKLWL